MNTYDFDERLDYSHGVDDTGFESVLLGHIPGAVAVAKATNEEDRNGTDWWVQRVGLRALSVDLKRREIDPIIEYNEDDLALETWSVIGSKVGWTRDPNKNTDIVLWYFDPTGRFVFIPFPMLCHVFSERWQVWKTRYRTAVQDSKDWKSECVFVPRREIWAELYRVYGGMSRSVALQSNVKESIELKTRIGQEPGPIQQALFSRSDGDSHLCAMCDSPGVREYGTLWYCMEHLPSK